jgi:ATP-dependent helicase/nuclease subunit A
LSPAARETQVPPLNPSDAVQELDVRRAAAGSQAPAIALERGRLIHRLLDALASVEEARRESVAGALARSWVEDAEIALRGAEEALRVRNDPTFASLFAAGSYGEIALRGRIQWRGREVEMVARADRLVVAPDRVLVVEFKTDRAPPAGLDGVSPSYLVQLALYARAAAALFPDRRVECAVLWTAAARLDVIPSKNLDAAVAALDPPQGAS